MSDWIAIYDAPADNEPPFECLVRGDVFDNCVWVGGPIGQYAQVTGSIAMPLPYMPSHWRPAQSAAVKESLTSQEPVNVSTLTLNAADSAEFSTSAKDSGTCEMTTQQALAVVGISVDGVSRETLVAIVRRLQAENERLRENAKTISELEQLAARSNNDLLVENERLRKDADRLDWLSDQDFDALCLSLVIDAPHCGEYYVCGDNNDEGYGRTFREAIDAARGAK